MFIEEVVIDTLIDSLKILPFLIITYLIIEFLEHKAKNKIDLLFRNSKRYGSSIGAVLGTVPQCGIGVLATNLYAKRIITLGTLMAVYLSTSDEALIIFISGAIPVEEVLVIILTKVVIGFIFGFIIDLVLRKREAHDLDLIIEEEHAHCHGIAKSVFKRSFTVFGFLIIILFALNSFIFLLGEENLQSFMLTDNPFQPLLTALIGIIPSCVPSVLLAELYANGLITFGSVIAGLCSAAGAGLIVLFRVNKNIKENLMITLMLYMIGAFMGLIINIFM